MGRVGVVKGRLTQEALLVEAHFELDVLAEDLDRDVLVERKVARLDHDPHSTNTQRALDSVLPEQDGVRIQRDRS